MSPSSRHLRESPPRYLDILTKLSVIFGGAVQVGGWFFLFIGSIFCWVFIGNSEVNYWFQNTNKWLEAPGVVLSAEPTNASENEIKVFRVLSTFEIDGETFLAEGYINGNRYSGGETITVKYKGTNPNKAYIKGLKRGIFGSAVIIILLFPLIGLIVILIVVSKNLKSLKLLLNGTFTRGTLISKEATNAKVNNQPVNKYKFSFMVGGNEHFAECKTHDGYLVEDEEKEIILYDQFTPEFNVIYDAAPMPAINEHGQLVRASGRQLLPLLLPVLTIVVILYFLLKGVPNFVG